MSINKNHTFGLKFKWNVKAIVLPSLLLQLELSKNHSENSE
jgi:hypothetical protein